MNKKLIQEDDIRSAAGATLRPKSAEVDTPKSLSHFEVMAQMIGAAHAKRDDQHTKFWDDAVALVGKEARNIPDGNKDRNSSSIDMKPSDAPVSSVSKHSYSEMMPKLKEAIEKDLAAILEGEEGLTDDFKKRAAVLFETAVTTRVKVEQMRIEEELAEQFDEDMQEVISGLAEDLDNYLEHIANKWIEENEVAVESSLRNELSEEFILGLRNLFAEHFIDIPEDRTDVVDSLAQKVEELEEQLSEVMTENSSLRKIAEHAEKQRIVDEACEGLTLLDAEKFILLSESVEEDDLEEFSNKVKVLRELNFKKLPNTKVLTEFMEEVDDENNNNSEKTFTSPSMKHYASAISRTSRK